MAKWTIPPERMAEAQKELINDVRRVYAFEIFNNVVARTPVDTGAARQDWLVTLNSEDHSFDPSKHKGQHGLSKGEKVIDNAKGDDTIFIQNNAPYINMLEYGGYGKRDENGNLIEPSNGPKTVNGFSRQAPHGMVGVTMAKAQQLFDKAVNAVKGGR
jgi:hypothetical protein